MSNSGIFARRRVSKAFVPTSRLTGVRKSREMDEIPPANPDILEFPGYVDKNGVLRVYNWNAPRSEMHHDTATAFCEAAEFNMNGSHQGDPGFLPSGSLHSQDATLPLSLLNAWVLRESERVYLLPRVQHAYIYLVPVGEEHLPPKVFGRVPLTLSAGAKAAFDKKGVGRDAGEWPPPEACVFGNSDNWSEPDMVAKAGKEID